MTTIVGYEDKEGNAVYIGGDSALSGDDFTINMKSKKVFRVGEFVIGCAGSARASQIIEYHLDLPWVIGPMSDKQFMVQVFADTLCQLNKKLGANYEKETVNYTLGEMLIGYRGKLYGIFADYQVVDFADGFAAIGSGAQIATGALAALVGTDAPKNVLKKALRIASRYNVYTRPPFVIKGI